MRRRARVQIAVATLSGNSLRQLTVHTHCASVHQAAKLVAALLRVAGVTAGLTESNGSLPSGSLTSPAGWLPRTRISSRTLRSVIEYGLPLSFTFTVSVIIPCHISSLLVDLASFVSPCPSAFYAFSNVYSSPAICVVELMCKRLLQYPLLR